MCALICVLSYVCSSMCALLCAFICLLSCVCYPICSHMCYHMSYAFICVLSYVCSPLCSHMSAPLCSHLCAIICVLSSSSSPPLVSYPFAPPHCLGSLAGIICFIFLSWENMISTEIVQGGRYTTNRKCLPFLGCKLPRGFAEHV